MLQDVGVSWEWNDDADWQPMALGHEQLAELMTAWLTLSADLRVAILAIVRSADVAEDDESSADSLSLPDGQRTLWRWSARCRRKAVADHTSPIRRIGRIGAFLGPTLVGVILPRTGQPGVFILAGCSFLIAAVRVIILGKETKRIVLEEI